MDRLQRIVDAALTRLEVDRSAPTVVACSGGIDSSALAHVALALARAGRLGHVTLCWVDHQLRPGSSADGAVVERLARAGGGGFAPVTVVVDRSRASLEGAAREVRYAALARAAAEVGARCVLVGHTADDQAETVLMRIVAGTGLEGLAGIPARRGLFARPLLSVGRAETEAYCGRHAIAIAEDPTNRDTRHTRNRMRHQVLPLLRGENPRVDRALVELAARAGDVAAVIDVAAVDLGRSARDGDGWSVAALVAAPRLVAARTLAVAAAEAGLGPLTARHHAALDALLRRPPGGSASLDLPGGRVWREYDRLLLGRDDPAEPASLEVSGPDGPYEIRTVRPGDRMKPARLRGHSRKLSDLFVDARVPRRLRSRARVVVRSSDGAIEWAEHLGAAHGSAVAVTLTGQVVLATNKSR